MTPFEIMAQDCDEVIMLLNYFIRKAEKDPIPKKQRSGGNGQEYVHVNDRTATGGWW